MSTRIRTRARIAARLSSLRGAQARIATVAGIVTFAILAGTTSSYAYFQMTQGASTSATAGTLAISTSNFTSLAYTFRNDQLDTVGSVTVTNTSDAGSTAARSVSITLAATGDATAESAIRFIASVKGTAACAAKNTVSGSTLTENTVGTTWATGATLSASLAPGASVTYCLESYIRTASDLASTSGSRAIVPSVSASVGAQTWTAVASATTTEASGAIYPAFTGMPTDYSYVRPTNVSGTRYCWDVSGAGNADGTHVISWPCKTNGTSNQIWQFVADGTYYSLKSNNAQTRRAEQASAGSGSLIYTNTASTATTQDWQMQQVSTGLYQFVNRASGLCASATTASGDITLAQCTDVSATQRFIVSPYISADPTCTNDNVRNNTGFTLTWTTTNGGPFKVYVDGTLFQTSTAKTVTLPGSAAQRTVTITDSSSQYSAGAGDTLLATATLTARTNTVAAACTTSNLVD